MNGLDRILTANQKQILKLVSITLKHSIQTDSATDKNNYYYHYYYYYNYYRLLNYYY